MIKNYFKTAWRNLWKNKRYSATNIVGLAIGMAAVLIITLWVQNQLQYDNFYPHKSDIYKLWNRYAEEGNVSVYDVTAGPAAVALKEEYPEVEYAARMYWSTDRLFAYGDKRIKSKGNEVDPSFLQLFGFPLASGTVINALDGQNSIVLTQQLAKSLFGDDDPLEKVVRLDDEEPYKVTAVLQDLPSHTDFDFTYLIPLEKTNIYRNNWNTNTY